MIVELCWRKNLLLPASPRGSIGNKPHAECSLTTNLGSGVWNLFGQPDVDVQPKR